MKQYRFWAITYPLNRMLLYAGAILIIALLIAINTNTLQQFLFLCIAIALLLFVVAILLIKRVSLTPKKEEIEIKINGKQKYIYPIKDLLYIRGANINLPKSQGEINLIFTNQIFTFSIFDTRSILQGKKSKHIELLDTLIETYQLENKGQDKKNWSKLYIYWNPKQE